MRGTVMGAAAVRQVAPLSFSSAVGYDMRER